ncbi:hypothetical protein CGMCC3_g16279 [Colletotrichum fructicola]|nr:uncharacterized protein CGMCC3_g16279 [Colletotrichum fructicola]KAE9567612.1 hypothetical protein CGMCC3_g16279 [Colletotrichum fructicola]KAF4420760.1 hypothetical protein CFRS1_v005157 [Colletotrichum fructicola]KAF5495993.1 hypothetical protein CGCF413_v008073 [Colletotrichum fructicola]
MNLAVKCTLVTSSSIIRFAPLEADERDRVDILEKRQVQRFSPETISDDLGRLVNDQILPWMKDCSEDDLIRLIETNHNLTSAR